MKLAKSKANKIFFGTSNGTSIYFHRFEKPKKITRMASVKFQVRGKRNPSKITARLILDKDTDYRIITPIFINPIYFNNKSGKVRQIAEFTDKQNMQDQLDTLQRHLIDKVNLAIREGEYINSDWLKECLDNHFNVIVKTDYNLLINYCDHYVDKLKLKTNEKTGELG